MIDSPLDQLKPLFEKALELPPADRNAFVLRSCSGDTSLQDELLSLLHAHDESDGYFEKLVEDVIAPALVAIESGEYDATGSDHRVSHYEILERIGGGGMGIVYKARDTRLARTVALKFLPRRHASNPAARARLLAEARAASALDHPNIGVVYEIAEADEGRQFIAMAWYDGETLKEKIRRGPLAVDEAVAMTSQLASALAAAHAANIIHRDVKPANVIVPRSGIVKLVDFGIAKLMTDTDEKHATAGTIAYMSPEQTREAALDARTDIWSLGVVLYEQLAGQRPFRGESDEALISAIRNQPPPPLAKFRSDVPVQLAAVVEKCLRKEPAERYQTAEELCSALREWNTGATRSAHSRAPKIILVSLVVLVAAVLGTLGYSRYTGRSQRVDTAISHRTVSVAVLPLIDSTQTESTRYVTEGLADELRSELSRMRNVMVPSYLSSLPYAGTSKTMSQVASEMAANYVVTGAVRRTNDGERVNLRLVDGKNGRVLWTRELESSRGGRPSIARTATKAIVSKLGVSLAPEEKNRLDRAPTSNPVAYDLYLRGRFVELSGLPRNANAAIPVESIRRAQAFYSQARSLDRSFALARARLAVSHMLSATTYDTTTARRDQARLEAEVALRMDSLLPEAHEALAAYWKRDGNSQKAIDELQAGLRATPNYIDLIVTMERVFVEAGRWEDGASMAERAMRLDPRNPRAAWQATTMYGRMRRYPEAQRAMSRLIEISPQDYEVQVIKGQAYLRWKGSVDTLSAILRRIPPEWDVRGMATFGRYTVLRVQRRYRDALEMLDRAPSDLSRDGLVYHPKDLMRAEMYYGLGELREARQYYESARRVLVDSLAVHPKDASIHAALGLAYAGLGRKRDAVREADRAMGITPLSRDNRNATAHMGIAVEILGRIGELDRAFDILELLLAMPSGREATIPFIRVWPGFDPLRKDPRFDELLERFSVK